MLYMWMLEDVFEVSVYNRHINNFLSLLNFIFYLFENIYIYI